MTHKKIKPLRSVRAYEGNLGDSINEAAEAIFQEELPTYLIFNGTCVRVKSGMTPNDVVDEWYRNYPGVQEAHVGSVLSPKEVLTAEEIEFVRELMKRDRCKDCGRDLTVGPHHHTIHLEEKGDE